MLNEASKLKAIGFGSDMMDIDDTPMPPVNGGEEKSELDLFLEDALMEAGDRLELWTGDYYMKAHEPDADANLKRRMTKAELLLASLTLFDFTWSMSTTSENMISVEGVQVQMYNMSLDKQQDFRNGILEQAERLVRQYLIHKEYVSCIQV